MLATGIIYLSLGTIFFISGVLLLRKLNKFFIDFYMNVRIKLWTTVCLLSLTLLLRGALNTIRVLDESELN